MLLKELWISHPAKGKSYEFFSLFRCKHFTFSHDIWVRNQTTMAGTKTRTGIFHFFQSWAIYTGLSEVKTKLLNKKCSREGSIIDSLNWWISFIYLFLCSLYYKLLVLLFWYTSSLHAFLLLTVFESINFIRAPYDYAPLFVRFSVSSVRLALAVLFFNWTLDLLRMEGIPLFTFVLSVR